MEKIYGLTGADVARVGKVISYVESLQREGQRALAGDYSPRNIQFVQLTSLTPTDGAYPCRVMYAPGDHDYWISLGMAWARPANASAVLKLGVKYPGMMVGNRGTGTATKAVFRLFDACCVPGPETPPTSVMSCGGHDSHAIPSRLWAHYSFPAYSNVLDHFYWPMDYDPSGSNGAGWYSGTLTNGGSSTVLKIYCDSGSTVLAPGYGAVSLDCINTWSGSSFIQPDCDSYFRVEGPAVAAIRIDEGLNYLSLLQPTPEAVVVTITALPTAAAFYLAIAGTYLLTQPSGYGGIPEYAYSFLKAGVNYTIRVGLADGYGVDADKIQIDLEFFSDHGGDPHVKGFNHAIPETATVDGWAASTAYAIGDVIFAGSKWWKATAAGTSDAAEPDWTADPYTIFDGTVTWSSVIGPLPIKIPLVISSGVETVSITVGLGG